ncbi:hypothetical protein KR52_06045 [Synechococcus sp. KORDI-52]|uniref:hypothetical protein n=1 Tax=Synechococcus sp. KORDI-52 TaxID=585425 RepID=UPI0004E06770|nr:hypothetical protein [Synechococcus sp. KORDI-52]AII48702.1 hypothetical protein KR52_06045 [Synechococcus sp. KORDI-52]
MVGIHEAVAGGAAPHRDENVQLVDEQHIEAGASRQEALMVGDPPYFSMLLVSQSGLS